MPKRSARRMGAGLSGALALGVMAALTACGGTAAPNSPTVATVGTQTITKQDWLNTVRSLGLVNGSPLATSQAAEYSQVQQIMVWSAIEQYALSHHWITTAGANRQAQKTFAAIKKQAGNNGLLALQLKGANLTEAEFTSFLAGQEVLQSAYSRITKNVKQPSTSAVQAYYAQNQASFVQPANDTVQVILVKTQAEAQQLEAELVAKTATFAALAKKDSLDKATAQDGGQMGQIPTATSEASAAGVSTAFVTEMDSLKAGQYGIVKVSGGYDLMQVTKVTPAGVEPFNAVKSQILSQLWSTAKSNAFQSWGSRQLKKVDHQIDIKP
jgi:hypothetical protein